MRTQVSGPGRLERLRHRTHSVVHDAAAQFILWLTLIAVVIHAVVMDVAAVFRFLENPAGVPDGQLARVLFVGLKESSRPAALGGIFVALAPLLAAAGIYREGTSRSTAAA